MQGRRHLPSLDGGRQSPNERTKYETQHTAARKLRKMLQNRMSNITELNSPSELGKYWKDGRPWSQDNLRVRRVITESRGRGAAMTSDNRMRSGSAERLFSRPGCAEIMDPRTQANRIAIVVAVRVLSKQLHSEAG